MKLQKLLSYTRQAVDHYHMIQAGDKVAVGLSGGKDSLALLYALHGLKRFYDQPFELVAITVSLGFKDFDTDTIRSICADLEIPYFIVETEINDIVFNIRKEKNPCSLCAKMRKGAMNELAVSLGCNKIALGHHKEDIVETMMMSLFYESRIHTFSPVTYLDRMAITAIRPLIYCKEHEITAFIRRHEISTVKNPCPVDGHTKREYMKEKLQELSLENEDLVNHIFKAIETSAIDGYNQKSTDK